VFMFFSPPTHSETLNRAKSGRFGWIVPNRDDSGGWGYG
jgi:hypothetical protein